VLKFPSLGPTQRVVRVSFLPAFAAAVVSALIAVSSAAADSTDSSNWAGYAVHRSGVRFTRVVGAWTQPRPTCQRGKWTYSSTWIGLGGYNPASNALEQIGTELDCGPSGQAYSSAWYEVVPAPSQTIGLRVNPGDALRASVSVVGKRIFVSLDDLTRNGSFTKTLHAGTVDITSADWIEEAPSECTNAYSCHILPLADFRTVTFGFAQATSTTGQVGTITGSAWRWTRIRLIPAGQGARAGAATPGSLQRNGTAFTVNYSAVGGGQPYPAREPTGPGYIRH